MSARMLLAVAATAATLALARPSVNVLAGSETTDTVATEASQDQTF